MVVGCWKALAISRVRSIDVNEAVDVSDHEPVAIELAESSKLSVAWRDRALQKAGGEQRISLRIHAGCPSSQHSDQRRAGMGNPAETIPCFSGPSRARRGQ